MKTTQRIRAGPKYTTEFVEVSTILIEKIGEFGRKEDDKEDGIEGGKLGIKQKRTEGVPSQTLTLQSESLQYDSDASIHAHSESEK